MLTLVHRLFRLMVPLFMASAVLSAAEPVPDAHEPAVALAHRMEALRKAIRSGNEAALQAATHDVDLLRRHYGALDVTPLVEGMVLQALEMGEEGQARQALRGLEVVETWAPSHPTVLGARIHLKRMEGPKGYITSLPELVELTRLRVMHPTNRWVFLIQHLAWARFMATALLWGWTLVLVIRYRRVFRHQIEEPLSSRVPQGALRGMILALGLTLPVVAGLDPSLLAMGWLLLVVPFLHTAEVRACAAVLLLQLVHPALVMVEPLAKDVPHPSLVALQTQIQPRPVAWDSMRRLRTEDRAYLNGWSLMLTRNWAGAEVAFRGLAKHPFQAGVQNNLGVALFQQGRLAEARVAFEAAYQADKGSAVVLVNQSILAFQLLDTVTGAAKQEEARHADPAAYQGLNAAIQSTVDQRTYPLPLPDTPERVEALADHYRIQPDTATDVRAGVLLWCAVPILALLAFLVRARQSLREAHPTQCTRCGDPFHTTDSQDGEVCTKCHHLFVLKDNLHVDSRKLKVDEIAGHQRQQRWIHRCFVLLVPGLDRAFVGHAGDGFQEFAFFCLALGLVLGTGRSPRYTGEILPDPTSIWLTVGLVLLGIIYLRSWVKFIPRRS